MIETLQEAGFRDARLCRYFDSFAGTNKENVARKFGVQGATFIAFKM